MPKINIDDLCEPIEVTVGGKEYKIDDISEDIANRMTKISEKAEAAKVAGEEQDPEDSNAMVDIMAEITGADKDVLRKLGMRKRLMLITRVMQTISEEIEGKNVPKAVVQK